jgi:hypothetical protein
MLSRIPKAAARSMRLVRAIPTEQSDFSFRVANCKCVAMSTVSGFHSFVSRFIKLQKLQKVSNHGRPARFTEAELSPFGGSVMSRLFRFWPGFNIAARFFVLAGSGVQFVKQSR